MTKEAIEKLNEVERETGATSLGEVIRDAVSTYVALVRLKQEGGKIMVEKDGRPKELILPK